MADDATGSVGRRFADAYAAQVGIDPLTDEEVDMVLGLAADAAHASERLSAPLVCWIAARAGLSPNDARAAVSRVGG